MWFWKGNAEILTSLPPLQKKIEVVFSNDVSRASQNSLLCRFKNVVQIALCG